MVDFELPGEERQDGYVGGGDGDDDNDDEASLGSVKSPTSCALSMRRQPHL
jgi:hypothetical protein